MTDKKKIKNIIKSLEKARAELIKIKVWGIRFKSCDENISKALSKLRELLCPTWVEGETIMVRKSKKASGQTRVTILTEGKVKKGGVKPKPSSPKPSVKPSGQKPPTQKSE